MQSNQALQWAKAQEGLLQDLYQTAQSSKKAGLGSTPLLPHTYKKKRNTHIYIWTIAHKKTIHISLQTEENSKHTQFLDGKEEGQESLAEIWELKLERE